MIYNFIVLLIKGGQDVRGVSFNGGLEGTLSEPYKGRKGGGG